jgi:hypothetical protein
MTLQPFKSCHGTSTGDIYISGPYELVRATVGFGIERVAIIYHGQKVHQIEALDGLEKAMRWCLEHHAKPAPVPELDFAEYSEIQR